MLPELIAALLVGGVVLVIVGFATSIVWGVLRSVRTADAKAARIRARAVATIVPDAEGQFTLRFSSPGPELGVWAGVVLLCPGGEEDDRLRVRITVRANGTELTSGSFRLGEEASSPLAGTVRAIATRGRPARGGTRYSSTMALVSVPSAAPGTRIEVSGAVVPAPGVRIERCEIFATPGAP